MMSRPAIRLLAVLGIFGGALSGCVTATVEQVRQTETSMAEGDSIVVLGRRNRPSQAEAELDFIDCVSRNMGSGQGAVAQRRSTRQTCRNFCASHYLLNACVRSA